MDLKELENKISELVNQKSEDTFVYQLLAAYDFPRSTIALLKKDPHRLSRIDNQIILRSKLVFHRTRETEDVHALIDGISKSERIARYRPRFIIVTDFETFLAIDTRTSETLDINIEDLPKHCTFFLPWAGLEKVRHTRENPADIKAATKMARIYDQIIKDNPEYLEQKYSDLNTFLTRLLFCFFAEDSEIFSKKLFTQSLASHTQTDGVNMEKYLETVFEALNTADHSKSLLPSHLQLFPYANGGLFKDKIFLPRFSRSSRDLILDSGTLDWSEINPDIFGSMIQAVAHPTMRSDIGMHYTSVSNILKVIRPLFLDTLYEELTKAEKSIPKLLELRKRIVNIKFFDPACGSGNFLIISYKELCRIELKIIEKIQENGGSTDSFSSISLSSFYGIELDGFAHEVAKLSLWLTQHQMNKYFSNMLGLMKPTLPLRESGKIICGNAARLDWNKICPITDADEVYVIGNPPYLGGKTQSADQKKDMEICFEGVQTNYKELDYIACWFIKAAKYIKKQAKFAFVTTSSLCEGAQVDQIWPQISKEGKEIYFAYKPFDWKNNAKGKAGVTCSIIGIQEKSEEKKYIYTENTKIEVKKINGYLVEGEEIYVSKEQTPLSDFPSMITGNSPYENGNLMLTSEERDKLVEDYPEAKHFIRPAVGSNEYINGIARWCLWIENDQLDAALAIDPIKQRIERIKEFRKSGGEVARSIAHRPHQFRYTHTAEESLIIIPIVSSSRREYLPIGFLSHESIVLSSAAVIYDPEPYIFGIISSKMHLLWVRLTAGKLRGDIRYLSALSYNTFPFPDITDTQKKLITEHVYNILDERENHSDKTMAELYDPNLMPFSLRKAHEYLDQVIEQIYQKTPFLDDQDRLACLFRLYEQKLIKRKKK